MITKTQKKILSKHLKRSFIKDVLNLLSERNHFNKDGNPFSKMYVSHIFNGRNENKAIEMAILDIYDKRKEQSKKFVEHKKKLLK